MKEVTSCLLMVRVMPSASTNEVVGFKEGILKIKLLSGHTKRNKRVLLPLSLEAVVLLFSPDT